MLSTLADIAQTVCRADARLPGYAAACRHSMRWHDSLVSMRHNLCSPKSVFAARACAHGSIIRFDIDERETRRRAKIARVSLRSRFYAFRILIVAKCARQKSVVIETFFSSIAMPITLNADHKRYFTNPGEHDASSIARFCSDNWLDESIKCVVARLTQREISHEESVDASPYTGSGGISVALLKAAQTVPEKLNEYMALAQKLLPESQVSASRVRFLFNIL